MIDLWLDDSSLPDPETAPEDVERREQSSVFAQASRWLVLLSGLMAVLYTPLLLVAPDWRILSIMSICLGFSASVAIVRARFKALTPAVYTVAGLVILGIAGVATAVTGLGGVLPAAVGLVPAILVGLVLGPRHVVAASILAFVSAVTVTAFDQAIGWQRLDLTAMPALRWAVTLIVALAILLLAIAVFRRLDRSLRLAHESTYQLRLLYDASRLFGATLALDELLPTIARNLARLLDATGCVIFLCDATGSEPVPVAAHGIPLELPCRLAAESEQPSVPRAIVQQRAPLAIEDVRASPLVSPRAASLYPARSLLGLPLVHHDAVLGAVLICESRRQRRFARNEIALARGLAQQLAAQIANAQTIGRERRRAAEQAVLNHVSAAVATSLDPAEVCRLIVSEVSQAAGYQHVSLYQLDGRTLRLQAVVGHEGVIRELPVERGLLGKSVRIGQPILLPDVRRDPDYIAAVPEVVSEVCAPIRFGDKTIGVINVETCAPRVLDAYDLKLLVAIAAQIAVALRNAQLFEQTRRRVFYERLVRDITGKISASIHLDDVMQTAVTELGRALDASRCVIGLGADPGHLPVAYEYHTPDTPSLGTGYVGQLPALAVTLNERRTVVNLERRQIMGQPVLSSLMTPIFIRGRTAGILALHQCDRPRHWTLEQITLVEDVGAQLGIAIDNARLYQEATQTLSDLGLLHHIAVDVASARSLPEAVNRVVESVHKAMQNAFVTLLLVDPETFDLIVQAEVGYGRRVSDMRIPAGKGVTGWVAQTGRPVLIPDVAADPRYLDLSHEGSIRSELAVPLIAGSEVVGVLNLESALRDAFDEADLQMLTALGGNLATVIANLRLLDEVRAANARLRELDRLKSQFVANMSHELRTPLNAIIGFSEVLVDGLAGDLAAEQHELVAHIHSSGAHLLALINDVLDLSKIQAGKMTLNCRPIELSSVLDDALAVVAPLIDKKRQALDWEVEARLPLLMADGFRLKQILLNLLSNAHKFSPEGSCITIEARRDGEFMRFGVVDRGDGIRPQDHDVVFQEFAQLDGGLARPHEGTGLGLPISRRLVEMHGGRMWVESEGVPGQGAAFYFTIPIAREHGHPPGMPAASPAARSASGRPRALIATADRRLYEALAGLLREEGYQAVQHDTEQGMAQAAADLRPVLIAVDMTLPNGDGFGALRALKSMPHTRDIPIIVVAGADDGPVELSGAGLRVLAWPPGRAALRAALGEVQPAPCRVVVVDDDPLINELLEAMLHRPEYDVTSVVNDLDAIETVRREQPDVVVLDVVLSRVDGLDVLEQLRAAPATRDVPVIVLTGKALSDGEWERLKEMAQIVIMKNDLTRERLFDALRSVQRRMPAAAHPAIAEVAS